MNLLKVLKIKKGSTLNLTTLELFVLSQIEQLRYRKENGKSKLTQKRIRIKNVAKFKDVLGFNCSLPVLRRILREFKSKQWIDENGHLTHKLIAEFVQLNQDFRFQYNKVYKGSWLPQEAAVWSWIKAELRPTAGSARKIFGISRTAFYRIRNKMLKERKIEKISATRYRVNLAETKCLQKREKISLANTIMNSDNSKVMAVAAMTLDRQWMDVLSDYLDKMLLTEMEKKQVYESFNEHVQAAINSHGQNEVELKMPAIKKFMDEQIAHLKQASYKRAQAAKKINEKMRFVFNKTFVNEDEM